MQTTGPRTLSQVLLIIHGSVARYLNQWQLQPWAFTLHDHNCSILQSCAPPLMADPKGWINTREADRACSRILCHTKASTHGDRLKFGYWFHHLNGERTQHDVHRQHRRKQGYGSDGFFTPRIRDPE